MSDRAGVVVLLVVLGVLVLVIAPRFRSPKRLETYPVTGKITFKEDGKPLTGAILVAQVLEPKGGPRAYADLAEDGTFVFETELKGDGAVAGEHLLILNSKPPASMDTLSGMVHGKYLDFEKTPWRLTFSGNQKNHFELQVEKPAKRTAPPPSNPLD